MECNTTVSESVWKRSIHQFAKVCASCVLVLCTWEGVRRMCDVSFWWTACDMSIPWMLFLCPSKSLPCRWEPFVLVLQTFLDCSILPLFLSIAPASKGMTEKPVINPCADSVRLSLLGKENIPQFLGWPLWCFCFPPLAVILYKHLEMISNVHYSFFLQDLL